MVILMPRTPWIEYVSNGEFLKKIKSYNEETVETSEINNEKGGLEDLTLTRHSENKRSQRNSG